MMNETPPNVMPETAPTTDVVAIPDTQVHVPRSLELPAKIDTAGRVWPVAGLTRVTRIPLAHLLDAGVAVQWRLPDGDTITQDVGVLLVQARQADMDKGYNPVFEEAVPVDTAPDAKL